MSMKLTEKNGTFYEIKVYMPWHLKKWQGWGEYTRTLLKSVMVGVNTFSQMT